MKTNRALVAAGLVLATMLAAGCKSGGGGNTPVCTPGADACACKADKTCDTGLTCNANVCQGAACTPGADGCACKADGSCDTGLACQDKVCKEPACVAGTLDCPCKADNTCDAGLACLESACKAQAGTGLVVGSAAARACDVVFNLAGATVALSKDVTGVTARRGDRVAVSFTAKTDAAFAGPVASVTGPGGKALSGITPDKAECYDRLGKVVSDPGVKVQ